VSILKEIVPEYLDAEKPLGKVYLHPAVNQDVIIL